MPETSRIKCLLVDDIPQNLTALEALLQRDDVELLMAHSGREALELLLIHSDIALALLDVQMPEMNGFELAELMRGSERTQHIPLIFLTAGSGERDWQFRGYESGAVDFLYKPIDPHVLQSKTNVFFELHRRKQRLAQELEERSEALRVNEMFMGVLSHDLRTPLMSIMAAIEVIKRHPDPDKVALVADRLMRSTRRMAGMVEDLLDVTRIRQAGGMVLHPASARMDGLVHRTLDEVQLGFPGRVLEPGFTGDLAGVWDGERICQVLSNLVGNAVLHGDPAQPVRVTADGTASCSLVLTVTNGGTIPADLLPHLFTPFRGRERPPGRHQGLGLGLYIAHKIVDLHGGRIEVSSLGGSTCFRVHLPRVAQAKEVRAL
ncbi:hybrid sensor histidine kinase/response regulator [Hydrogenophaga laconesensis]|uniref:histidine kinase n=1 Tax=Hydrogenophaga laconesensis TaxID=1805971 RepID=A0ABU1V535_9BURK|nr:hybrid sensor histidine kinase/response regulator [Hydrogenophaga laconesensis]MDR7092566.1 signal transduction histidine kinase [Hydrogenophaga laconesensis]